MHWMAAMNQFTVLGASGFVGSHIVRKLNSLGIDCYAPKKGDPEIFEKNLGKVFYCVGMTSDFIKNPVLTIDAHVLFLSKLVDRAKFDRLVYLSSTRLYDGLAESVVNESADLSWSTSNPRHLYDLSKALGESITLTALSGRGCVARLSCVYDSIPGSPGFMSGLLQKLSKSKTVVLETTTGLLRDYIYVDDVVSALKAMLDHDVSGVFNVASGENISNGDLSECISRFGYSLKIRTASERQIMPTCDISKINNLGISPVLLMDFFTNYFGDKC